jgi:hypothetical protein
MNNHVVSYIIVEAYSVKDLEDEVNARLEDGWKPYGSISTTEQTSTNELCLVQPMILTE